MGEQSCQFEHVLRTVRHPSRAHPMQEVSEAMEPNARVEVKHRGKSYFRPMYDQAQPGFSPRQWPHVIEASSDFDWCLIDQNKDIVIQVGMSDLELGEGLNGSRIC